VDQAFNRLNAGTKKDLPGMADLLNFLVAGAGFEPATFGL
jgi:hypothetical protein